MGWLQVQNTGFRCRPHKAHLYKWLTEQYALIGLVKLPLSLVYLGTRCSFVPSILIHHKGVNNIDYDPSSSPSNTLESRLTAQNHKTNKVAKAKTVLVTLSNFLVYQMARFGAIFHFGYI